MVTREDVQKTERMVDKFVKEMDELKYNKKIGIQAKNYKSREKRMQFIAEKILEGSVRYINGEAGINARYNKKLEEYEREER